MRGPRTSITRITSRIALESVAFGRENRQLAGYDIANGAVYNLDDENVKESESAQQPQRVFVKITDDTDIEKLAEDIAEALWPRS